jgi:hypothetical protein
MDLLLQNFVSTKVKEVKTKHNEMSVCFNREPWEGDETVIWHGGKRGIASACPRRLSMMECGAADADAKC